MKTAERERRAHDRLGPNALLMLQEVMDVRPLAPHSKYPAVPEERNRPDRTVWVNAFGRQRRGIIVWVDRAKTDVAYVVPSAPDVLKVATVHHRFVTREPVA